MVSHVLKFHRFFEPKATPAVAKTQTTDQMKRRLVFSLVSGVESHTSVIIFLFIAFNPKEMQRTQFKFHI